MLLIKLKIDDVLIIQNNKQIFHKPYIHTVVANAFIENPLPNKFKLVHHIDNNPLDYRVENLNHVNRSLNSKGVAKPKHGTGHDNYLEKHCNRLLICKVYKCSAIIHLHYSTKKITRRYDYGQL